MAQRGAKSKHRPHSVVNQFKCFLYNHTATTQLTAGRLNCCEGKKASQPFPLPFFSMIPYDSLTTFILYLLSINSSFPLHLMQSISQNRLDGIIRGARRETVCPLQHSSTKSHTHIIHLSKLQTRIISSYTFL